MMTATQYRHILDGQWWEVRLWDVQQGNPLTNAEAADLVEWVNASFDWYALVKGVQTA